MQMNIDEALDIVQAIARSNGEGLLETMQYMDRNLFQFDSQQRQAFRVAFNEFAKLFAVKQ
jgi:ribosome biogenesis SPOUT family RNA methylase Rps3